MEAIPNEKIVGRAPALVEHGRSHVYVCGMILGAQKILDQLVRLLHLGPGLPAQDGGLDREHEYPGFRQLRMYDLYELLNVLRNALRSLAARRRQIVISSVDHHRSRTIGNHNAIRIMINVGILGSAEASVDYRERLHVPNKRVPIGDARRPGEDNGSRRHGMDFVLTFEGTNGRLPLLREHNAVEFAKAQRKKGKT